MVFTNTNSLWILKCFETNVSAWEIKLENDVSAPDERFFLDSTYCDFFGSWKVLSSNRFKLIVLSTIAILSCTLKCLPRLTYLIGEKYWTNSQTDRYSKMIVLFIKLTIFPKADLSFWKKFRKLCNQHITLNRRCGRTHSIITELFSFLLLLTRTFFDLPSKLKLDRYRQHRIER